MRTAILALSLVATPVMAAPQVDAGQAVEAMQEPLAQEMAAGAIDEKLGVPNSSLSFHLAHLTRAGLIQQRRQGRSLIYTADYAAMNALVGYLMENCCGGAACAPESQWGDGAAQTQERKSA